MVFGLFGPEDAGPFQMGVLIYDTNTNEWSRGKSGPNIVGVDAAVATTSVQVPQRVYVLGRQYNTTYLSNWIYDPASDAWSSAENRPSGKSVLGVVVADDLIYVVGETTLEQYVPISNDTLSSEVYFKQLAIVAVVLTLIVGITGLFLYSKKRKAMLKAASKDNLTNISIA